MQPPSKKDVGNANDDVRYVFGMGDRVSTVYIYNSKGVIATITLDGLKGIK
jgi:hypothetical protein